MPLSHDAREATESGAQGYAKFLRDGAPAEEMRRRWPFGLYQNVTR